MRRSKLPLLLFHSRKFGSSAVAFVYVSDDMEWGRKNLGKLNKDDHNDIYFEGAGEADRGQESHSPDGETLLTSKSSSADFALLASCNHTISTRGTFTIWAGRYAGGEVFTEFTEQ